MRVTYKNAGVNTEEIDNFLKRIKLAKSRGPKAFASLYDLKTILKEYKHPFLVSAADGVGTKLKVAQYLGVHCSVGIDLVAMNVNDLVCLGAKPLFFLDYLAYGKLSRQVLGDIFKGIYRGLKQADCLLLGGETAQMPGMYARGEYDLAGFCTGVVDKRKIIDTSSIREKDIIIGLASSGLHSNGFSLVRKVFTKKEIKKYSRQLLRPTRIYVKPLLSLLSKGINIKGIAHITGGAFYSKATKIIPKGYGMVIYKNSWPLPKIFKIIKDKAKLDAPQMYSVFNMGIGMILVAKREYKEKIRYHLNRFCKTFVIGEIVKSKEKITLI